MNCCFSGGRMRYRGSNSNNPNLMYQEECDRRMRSSGGGGKDNRSGFNRDNRDNRNNRDGDRSSSSSYRDRSRDHRNNYNSGSDQYQSYNSGGGGGGSGGSYNSRSGSQAGSVGGQDQTSQPQGQFGQAPPPLSGGLQPLMAQQFAPPQPPLMGFMGQPPYPFPSPPPPPPGLPPPRK